MLKILKKKEKENMNILWKLLGTDGEILDEVNLMHWGDKSQHFVINFKDTHRVTFAGDWAKILFLLNYEAFSAISQININLFLGSLLYL